MNKEIESVEQIEQDYRFKFQNVRIYFNENNFTWLSEINKSDEINSIICCFET